MNILVQVGRLTRDPEIKTLPGGTTLCQLDIATSEKWKDQSGETKEKTCFLRWKLWGRLGEVAAQYLKKGHMVGLTGRLELETWEKDGQKHSRHVANCDKMEFMPNAKKDDSTASAPAPAQAIPDTAGSDVTGDFPDDDIPF